MKQIDVLILVEHVARELDIACALRHLGRARHGLEIQVASLVFDVEETLASYRPRIVAAPYFYSAQDFGIRRFLVEIQGATWVDVAYEQILGKINWKAKRPRDAVAREDVIHLAAGKAYSEQLSLHHVPAQSIAIVGGLTYAQYREPYRSYFEIPKEQMGALHGLDPKKRWVFFPENFGAAFLSEQDISVRVENGYDRQDLEQYCKFARDSMAAIIPWCWELALQRRDVELIIRPRPANPGEVFIEACKSIAAAPPPENLRFIKEGSIREWIFASQLVVSGLSSSLIEATVAGRPTRQLLPIPRPDLLDADFLRLVPLTTSAQGLIDVVDALDRQPVSASLLEWTLENLLGAGDAFANTVDLFAAICRGQRQAAVIDHRSLAERGELAELKRLRPGFWRRSRRLLKPKRPRRRQSPRHEADHFTAPMLEERTLRWSEILG